MPSLTGLGECIGEVKNKVAKKRKSTCLVEGTKGGRVQVAGKRGGHNH